MPLKILPRKEVDQKVTQEETGSFLRTEEMRKLEESWRFKLAKAEKDFNDTLVRNRKEWEVEYAEHMKFVEEMKNDIRSLEAQKLSLAVPYDIMKQSAEEKVKDAERMLEDVHVKEENAKILTEELQDKLDGLGGREQEVMKREDRIALREAKISSREGLVEKAEKELMETTKAFLDDVKKKALIWTPVLFR